MAFKTTRRAFIAGSAAIVASGPARAIGYRALAGLMEAVETMQAIDEPGPGRIYVLASPGCSKSGDLWETTRAVRGRARLSWVPCGEGHPGAVFSVARALEVRTPEAMRLLLKGEDGDRLPGAPHLYLARRQDEIYDEQVGRKLWEATGKTPAMPTMVFVDIDGVERVVRGAVDARALEDVLAAAKV